MEDQVFLSETGEHPVSSFSPTHRYSYLLLQKLCRPFAWPARLSLCHAHHGAGLLPRHRSAMDAGVGALLARPYTAGICRLDAGEPACRRPHLTGLVDDALRYVMVRVDDV